MLDNIIAVGTLLQPLLVLYTVINIVTGMLDKQSEILQTAMAFHIWSVVIAASAKLYTGN